MNQKNRIEQSQDLKEKLRQQILIENIENFKFIIQDIANCFEDALLSNEIERKTYIMKIENHVNYLEEKYRDTLQERNYIKTVNEVIAYIKSL